MDRNQSKQKTVTEAKQQLRASSEKIDYLSPIKDKPIASISAAFALGFLLRKKNLSLPPSLLGIGLQLLKRM